MALITKESKKQSENSSKDTFYNYVKKLHSETTFNGSEVKKFSWYKKVLGLL
jgi:hypothetical protein